MKRPSASATQRLREFAAEFDRLSILALAAGKEFNDELTFILNHAATSLDTLGPDHPARGELVELTNAAMRCAETTRCLLMLTERARAAVRQGKVKAGHAHSGHRISCDETAAAVVEDGVAILSSVVASQIATHARYGGVVPELASREHLRAIVPVVRLALEHAGTWLADLSAIAVTAGPGLVGSLLVGVTYAKALCFRARHSRSSASITSKDTFTRWYSNARDGIRWNIRRWRWWSAAATRIFSKCAKVSATACSARRATMRPERHSTRLASCSGSVIPADR